MKTYMANPDNIERKWYVVDAKGKTLGRLSSEIARILRGKHKPIFTPHVDTGDHVIVINAELVELTGKKLDKKIFRHHTRYPGGLKEVPYRQIMETKPTLAIYEAVKGMLPNNSLGRSMLRKLKVYAGSEHNHQAQKPELLEI